MLRDRIKCGAATSRKCVDIKLDFSIEQQRLG